jgi:uncharacterized membrane protein
MKPALQRPVLQLEKTPLDNLLDWLAVGLALACWLLVGYYYGQLPEEIPAHFNASGQPDRYDGKGILIFLPVLTTVLVAVLHFVKRIPHKFNYLVNITEENAPFEYRKAVMMMRVLSVLTAMLMLFLVYKIIQGGLGADFSLGPVFYVLIGAVTLVPMGILMFWQKK